MIFEQISRWLVRKHNKGQSTWCFCPKCGLELCNTVSWYAGSVEDNSDLVRYCCVQCGHHTAWLFDVPTPILVEGSREGLNGRT